MQNLQASRGNGDKWPQVHALADQRGFGALFPQDPLKSDTAPMGGLIHQVDRNSAGVAIRAANREGWGNEPPDAVAAISEIWRAEVEPPDCRACDQ
jgi:hypothetical protein